MPFLFVCQILTSAPRRLRCVCLEPAQTLKEASPACVPKASRSLNPDADVWVIACARACVRESDGVRL